jgi:hypothetical protein
VISPHRSVEFPEGFIPLAEGEYMDAKLIGDVFARPTLPRHPHPQRRFAFPPRTL